MKKIGLGKCAICGEAKECTRDHLPPKGIFVPPRPSNLVTVRACKDCNNGSSKDDEEFMVYLAMHVAGYSKKGEKLFKTALKSLRHNKKLKRQIIRSMKPVNLTTPGGVFLGKGASIPWNNEVHNKIIERTIRGLYYHHYGEILGDKVEIETYWHDRFPEHLNSYIVNKDWMGENEFLYIHTNIHDSPLSSMWVFEFYGAHWASGMTIDKALPEIDI
ncbi:MAG: hypothetical protein Roseis2KO_32950 [Roseivirga sp.]